MEKFKELYPDVTTETIDFIINSYSELCELKKKIQLYKSKNLQTNVI